MAPIEREVRRQLDPVRNPYFSDATAQPFVCYKNGAVAARTVVVINRLHERKFRIRAAFFGFFECVNDAEVASSLFESVERYCRVHNNELLEGPFNPNHYSELGLQIDAFEKPPAFFQSYNPSYYPGLLQKMGFKESCGFLTARNERVKDYISQEYGRLSDAEVPPNYFVRHLNLRQRDSELEILRRVFNESFSGNWHYLPLSREEYRFSSKFLHLVTEPELVTLVEYKGEPVGALMCVFDMNPLLRTLHGKVGPVKYVKLIRDKKKVKNLIVYAVGIRKSHRHTMVYKLLLDALLRTAIRFETIETTWMSPSNVLAMRAAERLGMKPDKHFAIYAKSLT